MADDIPGNRRRGAIPKLLPLALVVAAAGGYFFYNYRLDGFSPIRISPRTAGGGFLQDPSLPPVTRKGDTIRIASFHIQDLDELKLGKSQVADCLADVIRRFDVVAIQGCRAERRDLLPQFIEKINAGVRHYDYIAGSKQPRSTPPEQLVFIFDRAAVEVDLRTVYTIDDPDRLLVRDPLVASFRVRGPTPEQAFTFTLVNVCVEPDRAPIELNVLNNVFRGVRNDGRNEDDVILLGDLGTDDRHLGGLGRIAEIECAITGLPTMTRGARMSDNIVFQRLSTIEFKGRAEVLDLMREYKLTLPAAMEISDHLPVWAEFSIYEGGKPNPAAGG